MKTKKFKRKIGKCTFESPESWMRFILGKVKMSCEYLITVPDDKLHGQRDFINSDLKDINIVLKYLESKQ